MGCLVKMVNLYSIVILQKYMTTDCCDWPIRINYSKKSHDA